MLRPAARFSKLVECVGAWRVHREGTGDLCYCAVLEGRCHMTVDGQSRMALQADDFVVIPTMRDIVMESPDSSPDEPVAVPTEIGDGRFRIGCADGPPDLRMRIGHCSFGSPDARLLVPLLPKFVLARGEPRLAVLMQLVGDETRARRSARELVLQRLLEVMLIEALRCDGETATGPGLARGLADERLAMALRALHARPEHSWTVAELAEEAALSRSAFFVRFSRAVGMAPMAYLLAWRMALAKRLMRENELAMAQIAQRVGYGSASAFSVAFARHAGVPPARYSRMRLDRRPPL